MQRAYRRSGRVRFSEVLKATGESKDSVRRAAKSLERLRMGKVTADPTDGRARIFTLNERGIKQTSRIRQGIEADFLKLVGAREVISQRVREFKKHLWIASGFIPPGDLTNLSQYKKAELPDNSPRFVPDSAAARPCAATSDEMPW
jgi:DNA-binding MarR family transcriptional regulator